MNPRRFYAFVESVHPWLYEHLYYPDDVQPKRKLDRLLRGLENHVDWYVTGGLVHELHALEQKTGKGDLLKLITQYKGNQIVMGPVGKIRSLGKRHKYWKHWTDDGFPCVEHVNPISGIIQELSSRGKMLYTRKYFELSNEERILAAQLLLDVMKHSTICLATQEENKRLLKNNRGPDPWATYDVPKSGGKINRKIIRSHDLPCKNELLMVL